jgi:copper chaperone CopZ
MMRRSLVLGLAVALLPLGARAAEEKITLGVPGIQCPRCIESLTTTLGRLDASVKVTATLETKQLEVSYDPAAVSLHQLVSGVSQATPVHNKLYEAGVIVTVEDPAKSAPKVKKSLEKIKGVANFISLPGSKPDSGEIMILLRPLPPGTKPADQVKASQIGEALEKGGVKFSGIPSGAARPSIEDADAKKKTTAKPAAKESAADKSKMTRPAIPPARSKTTGTAPSKAKTKDEDADPKPRFVILAGNDDKVYLVDHEGKNEDGKELKKFVKEGDKFGDYTVKEVGNDDGLYVVLENTQTNETIRVEHKKKEKEGDKPNQ